MLELESFKDPGTALLGIAFLGDGPLIPCMAAFSKGVSTAGHNIEQNIIIMHTIDFIGCLLHPIQSGYTFL